jgi:NRPS condensation-like uncharacterized protein
VVAEGRLDEQRLREAVRVAAGRHPIARARLAPVRGTDVSYRWEIADVLADPPLTVADCAGDDELDRAREALLSRTPPLDRHGPFLLLLARTRANDRLILNLHHAAGDGLAALRLIGSIARAYGGEDDPVPAIDPLAVRDVTDIAGAGSLRERLQRGRAALEYVARSAAPPARIEPDGAERRGGYGFALLELEPEEVEAVLAHRTGAATANDVLLGGLAVTVRRWNEQHDALGGTVYLMMPVNLRPDEWRYEMVGNYASYVSVRLSGTDQADLETAIDAAAERTTRIKQEGIAGLIIDLFELPTVLPTGVKKRLQDLIPLTGNLAVDTAVLSNLGRVDDVPDLGDAGAVEQAWFSPPGRMPLGASLGVVTLNGSMFVTLRYRHSLFDADAARDFLALLKQVLTT